MVEKLFREHYAEVLLASAQGTFRDIAERKQFFDDISQMKPEDWKPGNNGCYSFLFSRPKHIKLRRSITKGTKILSSSDYRDLL